MVIHENSDLRARRTVVLLVLCGLLLPSVAAAKGREFLEHYKEGIEAIEAERWKRAAELMQKAIDQRSDEARRLPRYLYIKPYIPHFYLGLAIFEQGNCSGAERSWKISERQGVIQNRPEYGQIELARELCRERRAVAKRRAAEPQQSAPPTATARPPAAARRTESPLSPTPESAFEPPPSPRGGYGPPVRPQGEPPQTLLDAAAALFGGDPERALQGLDLGTVTDPYALAQGRLLLAASELHLYWRGGEKDGSRLEAARRHVLDIRAALPEFEPPERYFSPRFLDFYYGQRPEEAR